MQQAAESPSPAPAETKKRLWGRIAIIAALILVILVIAARVAMPYTLRWYVNRTINKNPLYQGKIDDIDVHLWRGAYTIKNIRLLKVTGDVPVPLYIAKKIDLQIEWGALIHRRVVGQVVMYEPQINFVAGPSDSQSQTGAGGPWLEVIRELFPFQINSCLIHDASIHFRTYQTTPQVDVYLSQIEASIENLTNIRREATPLLATIKAEGTAMDQARFEYRMKLNPFSYHPHFELAVRLIGLDVTKLNDLSRAFAGIDFEHGFFDLVIEANAHYGQITGYVKPLFRNLQILSWKDVVKDNPIEFFWEVVVGVTAGALTNWNRDQLATLIPFSGSSANSSADILATVGNVLRNAFIRAYLPRFQGTSPDINPLEFGKASITEPPSGVEP